jgi:catechol 2,3-dioxygenase-like lactoylglutathione lyase family enzyme
VGSNPTLSATHSKIFDFFARGVEGGFSGAPSRYARGLTASNPTQHAFALRARLHGAPLGSLQGARLSTDRGVATVARMNSAARLFRVIMPATNIDESARFYSELLGVAGIRVSKGRHYFDCGGVVLAVYDAVADGDRSPVRENAEHVYFAVGDLPAAFERAKRVGGLVNEIGDGGLPMGEIARRPWVEVSFYLRDPSGNPLCLVDQQTVFTGP